MERRSAKGDVSDWSFSIVSRFLTLYVPTAQALFDCHQGYENTGYVSTILTARSDNHLEIE